MIKIKIDKEIDINISVTMEKTNDIVGTLNGFKEFHGEKVNNFIEEYLLSLKRVDNHEEKEEVIEEKEEVIEEKEEVIEDLNIEKDKKVIELAKIKEYGLTINGSSFNTDIDIIDLIECGKFLKMNGDNLKDIPNLPGNYWIATNEPILHSLNPDFDNRPKKIEYDGEELNIIYNGQGEKIRGRIKELLYRPKTKGLSDMSGISIDVTDHYVQGTKISHNKCLYKKKNTSTKGKKLPKYEFKRRTIEYGDIKEIYSDDDLENVKEYCKELNEDSTVYFKNGIDINEEKHKKYTWFVIYYDMNKHIYHPFSDIIEQEWRGKNGSPILCSYKCGR